MRASGRPRRRCGRVTERGCCWSGPAFLSYKERLRPLVEPDTVLFGNAVPLEVLGYSVPVGQAPTPARVGVLRRVW